jgi:hypothetical protein
VTRKLVVFVPPSALDDVRDAGREERVPEVRLETVYAEEAHDRVVAALREAHPYEEPAFDVYALVE